MIPALLAGCAVLVCFGGHSPVRPRRFARTHAVRTRPRVRVGWVVVAAIAIVGGPALGAIAAIAMAISPRVREVIATRRRRQLIDRELPDAIELLVLVIRAGMTPHQAITVLSARAPASVRHAFATVHARTMRGMALAEALGAVPELLGPNAASVADTLAFAERHGAPLGDALDQLAADVHERRRRAAEAEARKLPVRMSFPLVACTLPSFVLLAVVPAVLAALGSLDLGRL